MPPTAPDAQVFDAEAELEAAWQDGLTAAHHGRPLSSVYSLWTAFAPAPDAIRSRIEAGYRFGLEDLELFRRDMEQGIDVLRSSPATERTTNASRGTTAGYATDPAQGCVRDAVHFC